MYCGSVWIWIHLKWLILSVFSAHRPLSPLGGKNTLLLSSRLCKENKTGRSVLCHGHKKTKTVWHALMKHYLIFSIILKLKWRTEHLLLKSHSVPLCNRFMAWFYRHLLCCGCCWELFKVEFPASVLSVCLRSDWQLSRCARDRYEKSLDCYQLQVTVQNNGEITTAMSSSDMSIVL